MRAEASGDDEAFSRSKSEYRIPPRESAGAVVVREEGGSETRGALEVARRRRIRGGSFAARARERGQEEPSVSRVHAEELVYLRTSPNRTGAAARERESRRTARPR